jgi:hypothetical protein
MLHREARVLVGLCGISNGCALLLFGSNLFDRLGEPLSTKAVCGAGDVHGVTHIHTCYNM